MPRHKLLPDLNLLAQRLGLPRCPSEAEGSFWLHGVIRGVTGLVLEAMPATESSPTAQPPTVRVTGTVSEKDGQTWLDATKIEPVES